MKLRWVERDVEVVSDDVARIEKVKVLQYSASVSQFNAIISHMWVDVPLVEGE